MSLALVVERSILMNFYKFKFENFLSRSASYQSPGEIHQLVVQTFSSIAQILLTFLHFKFN
jgi:hypothetical protein